MSNNLPRAAVILRGHVRTWSVAGRHNVQILRRYCHDLHWYVSLWDSDSADISSIIQLLSPDPIIFSEMIKPSSCPAEVYNPLHGPSWQSHRCDAAKIKQEKSQGWYYDMIIDTRPDIYIDLQSVLPAIKPHTTMVAGIGPSWVDGQSLGMADLLFMSDTHTHSKLCQRHLRSLDSHTDTHVKLLRYCDSADINVEQLPFGTALIRPNLQSHLMAQGLGIPKSLSMVRDFKQSWQDSDRADRLKDCVAAGIDPADYSESYHLGPVQ